MQVGGKDRHTHGNRALNDNASLKATYVIVLAGVAVPDFRRATTSSRTNDPCHALTIRPHSHVQTTKVMKKLHDNKPIRNICGCHKRRRMAQKPGFSRCTKISIPANQERTLRLEDDEPPTNVNGQVSLKQAKVGLLQRHWNHATSADPDHEPPTEYRQTSQRHPTQQWRVRVLGETRFDDWPKCSRTRVTPLVRSSSSPSTTSFCCPCFLFNPFSPFFTKATYFQFHIPIYLVLDESASAELSKTRRIR